MDFTPLTDEQRQSFDRDGFLVVPGALPDDLRTRLEAACDRLYAEGLAAEGLNDRGFWQMRNCLPRDDAFLDLLDCAATVPLVVQLLTHNVQLITSHLVVRPPNTDGPGDNRKVSDWHRDGGTSPRDLGLAQPRMFIKIAYWLSDLSEPGRGAIRLLAGSNDTSVPKPDGDTDGEHLEIRARPGDAVLFENRTLHAVGNNYSTVTRKSVFFGYGYRWIRPMDYTAQPEELLARCDPIRRQLLGDSSGPMGFQLPEPGEVPLREWLGEHTGEVVSAKAETPGIFATR